VIVAFTYTYDNAGMRTLVHEVGASVTWGYDLAYRLTNEERKSGGATVYRDTLTYDDVGNRTVYQKGSSLPTTYTYDAANQLETAVNGVARTTYTYDLNGNLEVENASGTLTTHTWNDENQLTQVAKTGMTTNQYTFNGDGQRVQIVDSQGTKKPIWDFENMLVETDGSNVTQVVYTLEPNVYGNLVSQRRGSTTSYFLFDALGSARKLTGSASSITDSYDFRAYGETFASSGSTVNVFRWVGELGYYLDIDRLAYYLRARPYNPAIARFVSRDPVEFFDSYNLYEYVRNRPTIDIDPSGLVLGFNYGRYCGFNKVGPGRPDDSLDAACQRHDRCLATWKEWINPCLQIYCNNKLCDEARKALKSGCKADWPGNPTKQKECEAAAMAIAGALCTLLLQSPDEDEIVRQPPPWGPTP
jgi:RHS repeat-associated protein